MDGAGNHFLARTGFSGDEDGGVVVGYALHHAEELMHGFAAHDGNEFSDANPVAILALACALIFTLALALVLSVVRRCFPLRAYTETFSCHCAHTSSPSLSYHPRGATGKLPSFQSCVRGIESSSIPQPSAFCYLGTLPFTRLVNYAKSTSE